MSSSIHMREFSTWAEFKQAVEACGVADDSLIGDISVSAVDPWPMVAVFDDRKRVWDFEYATDEHR